MNKISFFIKFWTLQLLKTAPDRRWECFFRWHCIWIFKRKFLCYQNQKGNLSYKYRTNCGLLYQA